MTGVAYTLDFRPTDFGNDEIDFIILAGYWLKLIIVFWIEKIFG